MFKRRSVIAGGLSLVAAPMVARTAAAQGGKKPILVFAGDETSEASKVWRTQWEPLFKQAPVEARELAFRSALGA